MAAARGAILFDRHTLDADRRKLCCGAALVVLRRSDDRALGKHDLIASVRGGRIVSDSRQTSDIAIIPLGKADGSGVQNAGPLETSALAQGPATPSRHLDIGVRDPQRPESDRLSVSAPQQATTTIAARTHSRVAHRFVPGVVLANR
jgi:hypothetical protein